MNHIQERTEFSTTETVIHDEHDHEPLHVDVDNDNVQDVIYDEPESATPLIRQPHRQPVRRERNFANHPNQPSYATIPPSHPRRTLVLCFDGTGDQFDNDNSNVVKLCSLLKKDDASQQRVYYQSGIGTYLSEPVQIPFAASLSKSWDQMVAYSLDHQVMHGYTYLMQTYLPTDRICIFGFSRGAYTARALAGMLHKVGLLPAHNHQQIPFAYALYARADPWGWQQSEAFKRAFAVDVEIEFMGVWDTVDSVGLIPRRLPFTTSNTLVKTFRHALALDERRAKFKANSWNRSPEELNQTQADYPKAPPPSKRATPSQTLRSRASKQPFMPSSDKKPHHSKSESEEEKEQKQRKFAWETTDDDRLQDALQRAYSERHSKPTSVEEVWFAGSHTDVGGGSHPNSDPHSLSRISLRWMIRETFKAETGIMFDSERLKEVGLDPNTLWPLVLPRPAMLKVKEGMGVQRVKGAFAQRVYSRIRSALSPPLPLPPSLSPSSPSSSTQGEERHSHDAFGALLSGSEELEDLMDSLSPSYDQLKLAPVWYILEILPMWFRVPDEERVGGWKRWFGCNLWKPRVIVGQKRVGADDRVEGGEEEDVGERVKIHRSVKSRMDTWFLEYGEGKKMIGKRYIPKVKIIGEPIWVD